MHRTCAVLQCHQRPLCLHHIFQHYLINGLNYGTKVIEHKMCVLIFCASFISNISHSNNNSASCYTPCTCKNIFVYINPLFSSDFNDTLFFETYFWNKTKISNIIEVHPVGADLFYADKRTGEHEDANSRFFVICERAWKVRLFCLLWRSSMICSATGTEFLYFT